MFFDFDKSIGQSFSALCTSSLEYVSSVSGSHSLSETMLLFSLTLFGLIGSKQFVHLLNFVLIPDHEISGILSGSVLLFKPNYAFYNDTIILNHIFSCLSRDFFNFFIIEEKTLKKTRKYGTIYLYSRIFSRGVRILEIIREDAFRKQLKKGISGGYLFFGDEDYMKSYCVEAARRAVCEDEAFALFNDMKIDAMDYSADALLDALMPLPMMSEKKIVTVNGLNIDALRAKELDDLCDVLATLTEYDYNVLIISVPATMIDEGNLPKNPSTILKRLAEYITPVNFEPITGAKLVSWVGKHFEHNGVEASADVCAFLIDYAGRSMYTLSNETEKLSFYALSHGRKTVTKDDVLNVSIAEITTDAFSLANAIMDGRSEDAINALAVMKFRRVDPIILMSEVSRAVCDLVAVKALLEEGRSSIEIASILKMNEYKTKLYAQGARNKSMKKLKEALDLCYEADAAVKFSPQGYLPIENLVCSI